MKNTVRGRLADMMSFFSVISILLILVLIGLVIWFFVQKDQRRKKLVNSRLQLQIAIEIILHSLLLPILIVIILFVPPFVQMFSNAPGGSIEERVIFHQQVIRTLFLFNYTKWPLIIIILLFIGLISIIFSHHIVGPLVKLRSLFQKVIEKDLTTRLNFREGDIDVLRSIESQFNMVVYDFSDTLSQIRAEVEKIDGAEGSSQKIQNSSKRVLGLIDKYKLENPIH